MTEQDLAIIERNYAPGGDITDLITEIRRLRADLAAYDAALQVRHDDALETLRGLSGLPANYYPIVHWVPDDPTQYALVKKPHA